MLDDILSESSLLPYLINQAEAHGRRQGIEMGLDIGKKVGLREAVQTALAAHFGALDAKTEAAIASASRAACLDVLAHFINETIEQVQVRLATTPEAGTTEPASGA